LTTATTWSVSGVAASSGLRWHLHELDPARAVPLGALDRALWLDRLTRQLARREQSAQVRIARDLVGRCRALTRSIAELDRELHTRTQTLAPRLLELASCGALSAARAALRDRPDRPLPKRRASRPSRQASHPSTLAQANTNATASTAAATYGCLNSVVPANRVFCDVRPNLRTPHG
jgi:hypothetical protein